MVASESAKIKHPLISTLCVCSHKPTSKKGSITHDAAFSYPLKQSNLTRIRQCSQYAQPLELLHVGAGHFRAPPL